MATVAWGLVVAGLVLLLGVHVAFPAVTLARGRLRPRPVDDTGPPVPVSVVLAAHDEADVIAGRVRNLLASDYPPELLQVVVACDGDPVTHREASAVAASTDVDVEVLDLPRVGKAGAMNAAIARARHDVVAFTDANTRWEAGTLRALVAPFEDAEVGGVAGDQRYLPATTEADAVAAGEATYWSLDRQLKLAQSRAGSVTSATGAAHALRRELVPVVPPGVTDDFWISTAAIAAGRRLVFAPGARAHEPLAADGRAEFSRKVRVMTRGLRAVRLRAPLLDPRRHGGYAIQLLVHKVMRRLGFVPLVLLAAGAALGAAHDPLLAWAAALQGAAYLAAVLGLALAGRGVVGRLLGLPAYVLMVNAAAVVAVVNVLRGREIARWDHRRAPAEGARG